MSNLLPWPRHRRTSARSAATALAVAALVLSSSLVTTSEAQASPASATHVPASVQSSLPGVDGQTHEVSFDKSAYLIDGKPVMLYSGEFHYFRLPSPSLWRDVFQKMKAGGFNAVSLYFDWGYHSSAPGQYDFTGIRDVDLLLDMAAEEGLYVIARPGPYINAEVTGGGFPSYLTTTEGETRTSAADYMHYADEWMSQINTILARHQVSTGQGSVLLYQVENEYYAWNYNEQNAGSDTYVHHLMDRARAEGISVPLIGNHNGSRSQIVQVDGPDRYPGGVSCSDSGWPQRPDVITNQKQPNGPMSVPEYAAAWYQGWGGSNYEDCAVNGYGPEFVDVFYKDVLGQGATYVNYYMAYGGTNWGWTNDARNQTSYDYGAGITEGRQLREKYETNKLIGYFVQSHPDLAHAGDPDRLDQIAGATLTEQHRVNPGSGAQFDVIRHTDIRRTETDEARLWVATSGSELVDDTDARLNFGSGWNAASNESWTTGDYRQTEHWTGSAASMSMSFSGSSVRWFSSYSDNHGPADVYIDGAKVATVSTRTTNAADNRASTLAFSRDDLGAGNHTLEIRALGQGNVSIDAIGVGANAYSAPQDSGSRLQVAGRQSLLLASNTHLGESHLEYSTSQPVTTTRAGDRDVALLHNTSDSTGETLLTYASEPHVAAPSGVSSHWDATSHTLRLNYTHNGLLDVLVTPTDGTAPLELLLADTTTAKQFWVAGEGEQRVLVHGSALVRSASLAGSVLALTGDNADQPTLTAYSAATSVTWNGAPLGGVTRDGVRVSGTIAVTSSVSLPSLTDWKRADENPETDPAFDDSGWRTADKTTTFSDRASRSETVLLANEYGFDSGNTWYRGHFTGSAATTGIRLQTPIFDDGGRRTSNAVSVWLNGVFLGSFTNTAGQTFAFPDGAVRQGADNVVSVLTVNMGDTRNHERDRYKEGRGLGGATLIGATPGALTWRLQGVVGGYDSWADPARGPQSTGGLYGEREGWSLPGYDDSSWTGSSPSQAQGRAGVSWYRTSVRLDTPANQDTSVALDFAAPSTMGQRVRVVAFVNGWNIGQYIPYLGPQTSFPIPNGIINTHGDNTIALAVWRLDDTASALPTVSLRTLGSSVSPLTVDAVRSPGYDELIAPRQAATPALSASLAVPATMPDSESFDITGTVRSTSTAGEIVTPTLTLPSGWEASGPSPAQSRASSSQAASFTWHVSAPRRNVPVLGEFARISVASGDDHRADAAAVLPATALHGSDIVLAHAPRTFESSEWSAIEQDRTAGGSGPHDGAPITLTGRTVTSGLGMHAPGRAEYYIGGQCTSLRAVVGVDADADGGSVAFSIEGDGRTIGQPVTVRGGGNSAEIETSQLAGVRTVALVAGDAGDGNSNDHADWANIVLQCGAAPIAESDLTEANQHRVSVPATAHAGDTIPVTLSSPDAERYGVSVFSVRRDLGTFSVANAILSVTLPADLPVGHHRVAVRNADGTLFGWAPISIVTEGGSTNPGDGNGSGTGNGPNNGSGTNNGNGSAGGNGAQTGVSDSGGRSASGTGAGRAPLGATGAAVPLWLPLGACASVIGGCLLLARRRRAR